MCPGNENGSMLESEVVEQQCDNVAIDVTFNDSNQSVYHGILDRFPLNEVAQDIRSLWTLVWPIAATTLLLHSKSLMSMLFLGHLGDTQLAGGSLALSFANITGYSVIKGISMGMEPICSQAYGARKLSVIGQTFQKTICLLFLTAIAVAALWLNMEPILVLFRQDQAIVEVGKLYLRFAIPELFAQIFLHPLRSLLRSQGNSKPLSIFTMACLFFHLPINYLLVIYLDLGVKGVALASACNTINLDICLLVYFIFTKNVTVKPWHGLTVSSPFTGWSTLLSLAIPSVLSVCLEWWWYEIMLFLCGILDNPKASVAAMGILIQTTGLVYAFPHALSMGVSTRIGHELGADNPHRAQRIAVIGLLSAIGLGFTAFVFSIGVRSIWGKMYTLDKDILNLVSLALPMLGLCEIGNCPQTVSCGVLTGSARTRSGAKINLIAFYAVGLPVAVAMAFWLKIGFLGLWIGLAAAQAACLAMMIHTLVTTDWKHQAKRSEELTRGPENDGNDIETPLLA